jgi:hypothetical protein
MPIFKADFTGGFFFCIFTGAQTRAIIDASHPKGFLSLTSHTEIHWLSKRIQLIFI